MKKISILLVLISFTFINLKAQQDIQQIRKWYYGTKEEISNSKKGDEYGLYCDILSRNAHGASWRVVGNYSVKTQFWYNENPYFMQSVDEDPRACLDMVIENMESGPNNYYSEYLYHDGQLVFAFYKKNDEEIRFYFKNNKLIKQVGEPKNFTIDYETIMYQSEEYMKTFLAISGVEE